MGARCRRAAKRARWVSDSRAGRFAAVTVAVSAAMIIGFGSSPASTVARRLATTPQSQTRYSLVHGCYALSSPSSGTAIAPAVGPFTMQAAALGVYLLYGPQGDYLTDDGTGNFAGASTPSAATEWTVDGSSAQGFTMTNAATGTRVPVTFVPATGCAAYPEAQVDAVGTPFSGASPEADVLGTVEGHAHVTAFEFLGGDWHCGRPWSPFGVAVRAAGELRRRRAGDQRRVRVAHRLRRGDAAQRHARLADVRGLAEPHGAGRGGRLLHRHRACLEGRPASHGHRPRRQRGALLADDHAATTRATTWTRSRSRAGTCTRCRTTSTRSRAVPGKGWFRIVTDPFQARQVINEGKLAVIEGIEVSRIFGCGEVNGVPQCDESQIDAGLQEVHDLGVRTFFPIHEFDNAFGGTKMIAGEMGTVVNAGNRDETGSFWNLAAVPCRGPGRRAGQRAGHRPAGVSWSTARWPRCCTAAPCPCTATARSATRAASRRSAPT